MYMYYLLGYKVFGSLELMENNYKEPFEDYLNHVDFNNDKNFIGFRSFLKNLDKKTRMQLENTFILTLDGDVEFRPNAISLMIDKIKENKKIGSVCGRVYPLGNGNVF